MDERDGWIERARAGDKEAQGRLYEALWRPLVAQNLRRGSSPEDAEDWAQDAILKALERLSGDDPPNASTFVWFRSWALAVGANLAADRLRERHGKSADPERRRSFVSLDEETAQAAPAAEAEPEDRERLLRLRALVASLPDRQREVVSASLAGVSLDDLARAQGIRPNGVVQARLRALKKITAQMKRKGEEPSPSN